MPDYIEIYGGFVEVSTDDTPPEEADLVEAEEIGFRDVVEFSDGDNLVYWSAEEKACIAYTEGNVLYYSSRHMRGEYEQLLEIIRARTGCEYGSKG